MYIHHMGIFVNDIEIAKAFYTKFFSATCNTKYTNNGTGLETYFLSFSDKTQLEIMKRPDTVVASSERNFHIAFAVGSKDAVNALTKRIEEDGHTVLSYPRTTGDGYYESVVLDNDGNKVEITV